MKQLYDEELKRLAKAKTKHCETVSDLIKIFCKIPPELLLDVVEVTDAGIYGFIFNADKLLDSDSFSSDFAYLLYEKDHFYNLGIPVYNSSSQPPQIPICHPTLYSDSVIYTDDLILFHVYS